MFKTSDRFITFHQGNNPNEYDVDSVDEVFLTGIPRRVTFISQFPGHLALPDSCYLALHAVCARVLQLSGTADYIEESIHDEENLQNLSSDGNSADLLAFALTRHTGVDLYLFSGRCDLDSFHEVLAR